MDTLECNGWRNWATWNVNIWSENDETIYRAKNRYARFSEWTGDMVASFIQEWFPNGTPDMDGAHEYSDVDWDGLAESWNEE